MFVLFSDIYSIVYISKYKETDDKKLLTTLLVFSIMRLIVDFFVSVYTVYIIKFNKKFSTLMLYAHVFNMLLTTTITVLLVMLRKSDKNKAYATNAVFLQPLFLYVLYAFMPFYLRFR